MNDVSKFIRYTLPGLVCCTELLVALLLSDGSSTLKYIQSVNAKDNIGLILGTFLASGALGYIFSQIYFGILWLFPNSCFAIDHRNVFIDYSDKIDITSIKGDSIMPDTLSKRDAQTIFLQQWFANAKENNEIEGIEPIVGRLYDTTHGIGATLIGSIFSYSTWIYLHFSLLTKPINILIDNLIIAGWLFLLLLMTINYKRTQNMLEEVLNSTFIQLVNKKNLDGNSKMNIIKS